MTTHVPWLEILRGEPRAGCATSPIGRLAFPGKATDFRGGSGAGKSKSRRRQGRRRGKLGRSKQRPYRGWRVAVVRGLEWRSEDRRYGVKSNVAGPRKAVGCCAT